MPDTDDNEEAEDGQDEPEDPDAGNAAFTDALAGVRARCDAAGLKLEVEPDDPESDPWGATVYLPMGRDTRPVLLVSLEDVQRLLATQFEDFRYLDAFDAIWNQRLGTVEANLVPLGSTTWEHVVRVLTKHRSIFFQVQPLAQPIVAAPPKPRDAPIVSIGPRSEAASVLLAGRSPDPLSLTLRVESVRLEQHGLVQELLGRLANSILFRFTSRTRCALALQRPPSPGRSLLHPPYRHDADPFAWPAYQYDQAPMSLFWYAQDAAAMPLLQFLAYYQVVEFYFQTYARAELQRVVRNILRDPAFTIASDHWIGRVIAATGTGGSRSSELDALKATIRECVQREDIESLLAFDEKQGGKLAEKVPGVADYRLNPKDRTHDLRDQAAERIYDVRCRVVHTKEGGGNARGEATAILPYSKEAALLESDILLVRFIAIKVLSAASVPLVLPETPHE